MRLSRFGAAPADSKPAREPSGGESVNGTREVVEGEFRSGRLRVDDAGVSRPFMLGILVHSLTESGLAFEEAYSIAENVWARVRDQGVVTKAELRELVTELTGRVSDESGRLPLSLGGQLQVVGASGRWPFNQGRLQQSFLASGLAPRAAFELVFEIEQQLRLAGESTVTRDEIRARAHELLVARHGGATADRYRAWRHYQNEDTRPVIVLLGGTSGVGKSSLALEIARRLSIGRVLSTDSIRDVMRVVLSDDLVPTLHVSSFEAHTRVPREGEGDSDPVIDGFLEQTRTVSVGVRAVVERALVEGTSLVLDGVSLVPGLLDLEPWRSRAHVFFMVVADFDRESLYGHLIARADDPGTRNYERYVRNFQEIFRIQEDLLERAEAADVPIVDIQDLESAAEEVVQKIVGTLGARRAAEKAALD